MVLGRPSGVLPARPVSSEFVIGYLKVVGPDYVELSGFLGPPRLSRGSLPASLTETLRDRQSSSLCRTSPDYITFMG